MSVYVLYYNNALRVKVSMERTFAPGDKFRMDGKDCIVDKVIPDPMGFSRVYFIDKTEAVDLVRAFAFRKRKRLSMASND